MLTALSSTDGSNNPYSIPLTAFSDLRSTTLTPVTGWTFNYGINSDYVNTVLVSGGTATQANSMAIINTNTSSSGSAQILTRKTLRYNPGLGNLVRFTAIFTIGVANSQQTIGVGDPIADGFFFGYNGTAFSILRVQNGTPNWTAQTAWNGDKMNGSGPSGITLDTTKGNVYAIEYQWLGFGVVNFYISSTTTGQFILVNRINYPNTAIVPSIANPTLPLSTKVLNIGNTSNIVLKTPSAMGFCEGDALTTAINAGVASVSLTSKPTNQNVLTLQNMTTFNGYANRTKIRFDIISTAISASGSSSATFQFIKNAIFTPALTYTAVSSNSIINYSSTLSTISGGIAQLAFDDQQY